MPSRSTGAFLDARSTASPVVTRACGRGSVSERRFPASHSMRLSLADVDCSVSERRFPASHSMILNELKDRLSVSERRFPASHSGASKVPQIWQSVSERRFPASHSDGSEGRKQTLRVYPSGDSLRATAETQ